MLTFIHLTDTHLVPRNEALYGLSPAERLDAAIASINGRHAAPGPGQAAFVVITGDLTHWGTHAAYAELRAALDRLALPCHLLLGNHDDRAAFRAAFPEAPADERGFIQQAIETDAASCLLLDTQVPGSHAGELCRDRLDWLAQHLARDGRPVLLFLHHPPVPVGIAGMDRLALREPDALWDVLAPHRARVRHMFFGHLHRPVCGNWRGISFSTLRGTSHQVALDFARQDRVGGSLEPPAYAVVRVDADSVVVHMHDFLDGTATFDL
jgi:3',5'-cyclic AMP phosphodiesterase CpdA